MDYLTHPDTIESQSFSAIEPFLAGCSAGLRPLAARVIHATGDPTMGCLLEASSGAVEAGLEALQAGAPIWTDVQMVRAGLRRDAAFQLGCTIGCMLERAEKPPAGAGEDPVCTRAMQAVNALGAEIAGSLVAIGNAPTALFQLLENSRRSDWQPSLVVGMPVGFVGAAESKARLIREAPWPYVTIRGTRGGSPVAASVVNALLLAASGNEPFGSKEASPDG